MNHVNKEVGKAVSVVDHVRHLVSQVQQGQPHAQNGRILPVLGVPEIPVKREEENIPPKQVTNRNVKLGDVETWWYSIWIGR